MVPRHLGLGLEHSVVFQERIFQWPSSFKKLPYII
jgi:small subunit ribosomal protein S2e